MLKRFFLLLLIVIGWGGSFAAQASPWPYYSFEILRCPLGCGQGLYATYGNPQTRWRDISNPIKITRTTTQLDAWGVHCDRGTISAGFTGCRWYRSHAPVLVDRRQCQTTSPDNWILANQQACATQSMLASHDGAAPGAECAVLGNAINYVADGVPTAVETPFGILTAEMVANSGDIYCGKALPPPQNCNIAIANGGILDHGIQAPTSSSERTLDVTLACGVSPNILITDTRLKLDNDRIQSDLSLTPNGATYLLKSVLTSTNASAGNYSGSTVVVVTPN